MAPLRRPMRRRRYSAHAVKVRRRQRAPNLSRTRVPACGYTTVARLLDPSPPSMPGPFLRAARVHCSRAPPTAAWQARSTPSASVIELRL